MAPIIPKVSFVYMFGSAWGFPAVQLPASSTSVLWYISPMLPTQMFNAYFIDGEWSLLMTPHFEAPSRTLEKAKPTCLSLGSGVPTSLDTISARYFPVKSLASRLLFLRKESLFSPEHMLKGALRGLLHWDQMVYLGPLGCPASMHWVLQVSPEAAPWQCLLLSLA